MFSLGVVHWDVVVPQMFVLVWHRFLFTTPSSVSKILDSNLSPAVFFFSSSFCSINTRK